MIKSKHELCFFNGSKYVQSHTNLIFSKVKNSLESGLPVLFSGTPCQNHALRTFLGKEHPRLIQVDLICHGVPSEDLFMRYLSERSGGDTTNVNQVRLRHKKPYWDWCYVTIDFKDKPCYSELTVDDSYFTLFNIGYSLRESCTACKYTKTKRYGDITLADFWGFVAHDFKSTGYQKGVSLVMLNTEKGKDLFSLAEKKLTYGEATLQQAINSNKSLSEPYTLPTEKVVAFWKDYESGMSCDKLRDKYTGTPFSVPKNLRLLRFKQKYRWLIKRNG